MTSLPKYRHVPLFRYTFFILAAPNVFANQFDVYEAITTGYNKNVFPVKNVSAPMVVSVELTYFGLLNMDQKQETITFVAVVDMIWKDENIGWNASEFGNISSVLIPYSLLWKPDIIVPTGQNFEYMIPDDQRFASVRSDGAVWTSTACLITNLCIMSVKDFPYDEQTCSITFTSWMYPTYQIDLIIGQKLQNLNITIEGRYFKGNGEWTLVSFDKLLYSYTATDGQPYAAVDYTVTLRRQPTYYICVMLIPTFVTATICLFGLFVPAMNTGERVEKVNMGLATLLSMAVILGIVAGEMPKATTLPLLGFYVLAELILCTIGVIVSMVIMVAHQRASTRALIPPQWLNKALFLKKKSLQEPEKTDVTTVYSKKAIRPLYNDKTMDDRTESIKNSIYAKQLKQVLVNVQDYINDKKSEEYILFQWIVIFDRIDMLFLVVFNTVNVIMSIILFK